ncbi:aspartic proteinase CDR1-like [Senna tora]|uniref:Aspartic proteinase CDR1-like n=1 Tax=Senna tora TaxID=362788 RepID=A0A834WYJ9_9FABA|nr:aspartic proteinase CDR1-like [Senna tora]
MRNTLPLFLALLSLFHLSISTNLSIIIKPKAHKLHLKTTSSISIDLIHREYSPLSPFYNSSKTRSELLQNAALRSVSRSKRLPLRDFGGTNVIPSIGDGSYLMRFYIGTPSIHTWAVVDTGSDLLWLQCSPCTRYRCFPHDAPLFDPKKSSTYKTLSCHSRPCTSVHLGHSDCRKSKPCVYDYMYLDGTRTIGELARDSIHFGGQTVSFHKSVFGCGFQNTGDFTRQESGIVGLGPGPLSLVSQLGHEIGHKFSYCLVPFFSNYTSKLKFGEDADISKSLGVVSTPFVTDGYPYYILNLEGITIGQKMVKLINEGSDSGGGNIVIDSGSTLTYLTSGFYKKVEALVREAIGIKPIKNPPKPYTLCFAHGHFASLIKKNLNHFMFHFKGADVYMKPDQNLFVQNLLFRNMPNLFCFAMVPIDRELSIYGDMAQINFQVEYDLKARKLSFSPTDCTNQ